MPRVGKAERIDPCDPPVPVSDINLAWLAGFFDGEGCVTLHGERWKQLSASIRNTHYPSIIRCSNILAKLGVPHSIIHETREPHRDTWYLSITGMDSIARFARAIGIHSTVKSMHLIKARYWCQYRSEAAHKAGYSERELEIADWFKTANKAAS